MDIRGTSRRDFIRTAAIMSGGLLLTQTIARGAPDEDKGKNGEQDISPAEDLMREHGILRRVLLIYGEFINRIGSQKDLPLPTLSGAANIIKTFIENYHEKLEEDYLFPRFRKAGEFADLVEVLEKQHDAGRDLTDTVIRIATQGNLDVDRQGLLDSMNSFMHMYRPHAAREDTVLFPAIREVFAGDEYEELSETFESKERSLFGKDGFKRFVEQVAEIEKTLGIHGLEQFTPT